MESTNLKDADGVTDNADSVSSLFLTQDRAYSLSKGGSSLANEETYLLVVQNTTLPMRDYSVHSRFQRVGR